MASYLPKALEIWHRGLNNESKYLINYLNSWKYIFHRADRNFVFDFTNVSIFTKLPRSNSRPYEINSS